jgi:glutamate-1-semialdehyde 2,1-aminomutase
MKFTKSDQMLAKARELIPGASQTYSKSYRYYVEGAAPVFLEKGLKGHVWDVDGNEYIDFVLGLGAITIGYNNKHVNDAIKRQLDKGISFTLPTQLEIELAMRLKKAVPCCEMARLVKNGSDATSAAVRLARASTRKEIIATCGYHGCQDWYVGSTINSRGVPEAVKRLTLKFKYNDIESLKDIFSKNKGKVAGVILEPLQENGPKSNFLDDIKSLCRKEGAILIFDEVVSGFRVGLGGAQGLFNVTPDLAAVGKGLGNGVSVSAVVGRADILKLIDEDVFISTTFGGEATALAGALATLDLLEKPETFKHIRGLGDMWLSGISKIIIEMDLKDVMTTHGLTPHCGVKFKAKGSLSDLDLLSVYQQELLQQGILTTGINNFCLEHTNEDVEKYLIAAERALSVVKSAVSKDSIKGILKGKKIRPIFRRE